MNETRWPRAPWPRAASAALFALTVAALAGLFAWEAASAGPVVVDDAYITFSFAKNLALGHGLVYGHGVRVEGYSNFLWTLLVAAGLWFDASADPLLVARIVAAPFMALLAGATYWLCRARAGRLWSLAAVVLLVINLDVTTAYLIGLETLAYTALLTAGFAIYVRAIAAPPATPPATGSGAALNATLACFVAVALTRIDGFVPLGFLLAFEGLRRWGRGERHPAAYLRWALPGLATYAAWFGWRWWYYGLPLPATYYAKALIPKLLPGRGRAYLTSEALASGSFVALPFAALLLAEAQPAPAALVLYVAVHALYVVAAGGDWMPYGRFLLPILPLLLVIIVWGGARAVTLARARLGARAALLGLLPLAAFVFIAARTERHLTRDPVERDKIALGRSQAEHVARLKAAAAVLREVVPPGGRLVTDYGGVMAYDTVAAPIEMWGLCNATIATRGDSTGVQPIYGKTCPACYPELAPEFFHTMMPMLGPADRFRNHGDVVHAVWQSGAIGRYLDFGRDFVSGRVLLGGDQALYFLERRQPGARYRPRRLAAHEAQHPGAIWTLEYPFEPAGK